MADDEARLEAFVDRFSPEIAGQARAALARMRALLPGAMELVYDNYNALGIGLVPDDKAGGARLSIVLYPRWVSLFFLFGAGLDDPHGLLKGKGSRVRHIVLASAQTLDDPRVLDLIAQTVAAAPVPFDPGRERRVSIRMALANTRPRRP